MIAIVHAIAYMAISLLLLTYAGNVACRLLFAIVGPKAETSDDDLKAGRIIGTLERLILAVGIITQSWEIVGAVIVLKTAARFKELDEKLPAETFLIGSLFSVLWAMVITAAWLAYDRTLGVNLKGLMESVILPSQLA